ncbi:MAG: DEAD/DEAH box helicase [Defluviitaleaceae bacterium]|nr:DEAD/DEAH box helicase [Defluviitaleaceae bacterium]
MPTPQSDITKGAILNLSSNVDAYERGERYFREGKLLSYTATEGADGTITVCSIVEGNYKNYNVSLELDSAGALSGYSCSCQSHVIWRGACKHVVAVLFAELEGSHIVFSEARMKIHAQRLTNNLEKIIFEGIDEEFPMQDVYSEGNSPRLTPSLSCSKKGAYVTFSVGYARSYVIKSIASFVKSFKTGETVTYGQGLTLTHRKEIFDEVSQALIGFITHEDALYAEVGKRLSRQFQFASHPLFSCRELELSPRNADDFFAICQELECTIDNDEARLMKITDDRPPFVFHISDSDGATQLHSQEIDYFLLQGVTFFYFFIGEDIFRVRRADGQLINSLLKAIDESPSKRVLFTGEEQQRFVSVVLPRLRKMGVASGDFGENTASALVTKMFFDTDNKDITARVEFSYEGENNNPVAEYITKRKLTAFGFNQEGGGAASNFADLSQQATQRHEEQQPRIQKKENSFRLRGSELIYSFLHEKNAIEALSDCAEIFVSEDLQKKTIRAQSPTVGLRLAGNLLKVSLQDSGYDMGELLEALDSYRLRKKFHRLKDGRFITLDNEAVNAAAQFLDALEVSKKDIRGKSLEIPSYRALYVDDITKNMETTRDKNFDELLANFKDNSALGFKTPNGLGGILREYQKAGYRWLKTLSFYGFGGILADDMGLGKTLQIIALLTSDLLGKKAKPAIVVAPTSLLYNWENEIIKFSPQLKTQLISGLPDKRRELLKASDAHVLITTYDMLKRDIEFYENMEFSYVIADEAQNIKNPTTQAAKSVKQLNGNVRFALTGTPIENTLTELWSIFDFIMPGYLRSHGRFSRMYETPIIKYNDTEKAARLRRQIAPFVLRRVKKSVLKELPEKNETTLPAELFPEQKKLYQANLLEAIGAFDEMAANKDTISILAQLTRLRQICCHPAMFLEDFGGESGKFALTLEIIQMALDSGHRILLFSQFTKMLALFKDELTVPFFYLDGATKSKERMEMVERFNSGERDLFLISLKAGGTGLNLTGADVVIHYDPWWNPSVMEQASDRAHRYGQEKPVQVYNIVAKDTIEEKIMELQEKKRGLIDSVITEGGSFINLLSEEELRKLFAFTP